MRRKPIRLISVKEEIDQVCYLANDIRSVINQKLLLARGTRLDNYYLKRLLSLGYHHVYVLDSYSEELDNQGVLDDETYAKTTSLVYDVLNDPASINDPQKVDTLRNTARDLISIILSSDSDATYDMNQVKTYENYVYLHSVNVSALGVLIGRDLHLSRNELEDFVVGALLHDIGKIEIPFEILVKEGPLDDDEFAIMREHTKRGFTLLEGNRLIKPRSFALTLQHHEAFDGSGYPRGLVGDEIHIYSRIAMICDIFDALTSDRPYKASWSNFETIDYMKNKIYSRFDPYIFKIFQKRVPPYPIGTAVKLNSGEKGIVVSTLFEGEHFPQVRIYADSEGNKIPQRRTQVIDLYKEKEVTILETIEDF
ncbi:MAG: HD-GYP domain-containing protein [FCB group bacterium]|nr:HD-GYP domain-containing protein [FCB group bacterium]